MSYANFLIHGPSLKGGIYDYKSYEAPKNKPQPASDEMKKIARLWENFKSNSFMLMLGSSAGAIAGALLIPGSPILGVALLAAAAAFNLFSLIRYLAASDQARHWRKEKADAPPPPKQASEPKQASIHREADAKYIEQTQKCQRYFQSLAIPAQYSMDFLKNFFDAAKNPLQYFRQHGCPDNIAIKPALDIYRQLYLSYTTSMNMAAMGIPNAERSAKLSRDGIDAHKELLIKANDYALESRKPMTAYGPNGIQQQLGGLPPNELAKMQTIHGYFDTCIKSTATQVKAALEDHFARYSQEHLNAEKNYHDALFQKIVAFVEAFNKKDLSKLTNIEDFKSPEYQKYMFKFPSLKDIPFDAAKLPGVTAADYQLYQSKCLR